MSRGALAAARSLSASGWAVGVGTPNASGLTCASRATRHRHVVPGPETGEDAFVDAIGAAVRGQGYEIVFPGGDAELMALSARRDEIPARVPYAPHEFVERAVDKIALVEAAAAAGLAQPSSAEATESAIDSWPTPAIVKAASHAAGATVGQRRIEAEIAPDRDSARRLSDRVRRLGGTPILQESIDGDLLAVTAVCDPDGKLLEARAQVSDRTWPVATGVTARARSVVLDNELEDGVRRLLADLRWFGVAQLQFIAPGEGAPKLIDFNGRFYGTLGLAVANGLDLPTTWAALATGRTPPPPSSARELEFQWLQGDLLCALALAEGRRDKLAAASEVLSNARTAVHPIWSRQDPRPALWDLQRLARRGRQRRRRRSR